ncbi:MAG TPA: hypothetical protein VMD53_12610 [Rhizomicrobium sp.]|nr:hypothetical protein [Rhizomicrobium sp.]
MRAALAAIAGIICLVAVTACSNTKAPPVGRWEGVYEAPDEMVVVRLEITPKGDIYLSAPNALDVLATPADQRPTVRAHLTDELVQGWASVAPRPMEFDGRVFRKPGGIAPQMEWNPQSRQMTVVLYFGMHAALRVPLRAVSDFSQDPWAA